MLVTPMRQETRLSLALSDNPRTRPILDGAVSVDGVAFDAQALHPSEMFWRQLHHGEFDVCEMSLASLMIAASRGDRRFVAIPVFTMRRVFHTGILVRSDRGIDAPADLRGKRVGVPEYQQSSAIWSRGILADRFSVDQTEIEWFMERGPDTSHGAATGFTPPPGVTIHQIAPDKNIGAMMLAGELDATLLYLNEPNAVDRSRIDLSATPLVRPLFADPAAEAARYVADTGFVPVNHVLVAHRALLAERPGLAQALYEGFAAARRTSGEPGPSYGLAANRAPLETLARYVHTQGLTDHVVGLDTIFHGDLSC